VKSIYLTNHLKIKKMKKVILCAALALVASNTFASVTVTKQLTINAVDFLTLTPLEMSPLAITWNSIATYEATQSVGAGPFHLTANHDFTVTLEATDFLRQAPAPTSPLVPLSVEPQTIMTFKSAWTAGEVCNTYVPVPIAATNAPQTAVYENTGTASTDFEITLYVTGNLDNNMSGTYISTVSVIASLN
jgi:hypothetical protein